MRLSIHLADSSRWRWLQLWFPHLAQGTHSLEMLDDHLRGLAGAGVVEAEGDRPGVEGLTNPRVDGHPSRIIRGRHKGRRRGHRKGHNRDPIRIMGRDNQMVITHVVPVLAGPHLTLDPGEWIRRETGVLDVERLGTLQGSVLEMYLCSTLSQS